jgi:hypothetical protein
MGQEPTALIARRPAMQGGRRENKPWGSASPLAQTSHEGQPSAAPLPHIFSAALWLLPHRHSARG